MFIDEIIKKGWDNLDSDHPKDRRMQQVYQQHDEMSRENIRYLINSIVKQKGGLFFEAGCFRGAGLVCAAFGNPHAKIVGADPFKKRFDKEGKNYEILKERIKPYPNITFYPVDYKDALEKLGRRKIDVFVYDADHSYEATLEGLFMASDKLKKGGVIIVDDITLERVRKAIDYFKEHSDFKTLFRKQPPRHYHEQWFCGVEILG